MHCEAGRLSVRRYAALLLQSPALALAIARMEAHVLIDSSPAKAGDAILGVQ